MERERLTATFSCGRWGRARLRDSGRNVVDDLDGVGHTFEDSANAVVRFPAIDADADGFGFALVRNFSTTRGDVRR